MYNSLLDTIGNTPLVKVDFGTPPTIYAKLEYFNPSGSIKDRIARFMLEEAEKNGALQPGGTIIEASSGNQGIAVALFGAIRGYKVIITVANKVSAEKKAALQAYGAHLVECPTTTSLDDPRSYHTKARNLHEQTPNSFFVNQYYNPNNCIGHYHSLGPEIWQQTNSAITHFCGGIGSGGTVVGAGQYLKEQNPEIEVLGVDSPCSYRSTNGNPKKYILEGMGVDFDTPHIKNQVIDKYLTAGDNESIEMLKSLAHHHGILVGPASGAVACAIKKYSATLSSTDTIVMIFGDSGRAYLSRNFYHKTHTPDNT